MLVKPARESALYDWPFDVMYRGASPPTVHTPSKTRTMRAGADGLPIRILVAEDNLVNQLVVQGILSNRGYSVDIVENGLEAVGAVMRERYAVVLMDCQMPEMDGYAAALEIRRREGNSRHTPIIALTAHVLQGEREKCLAAGMDDYISKPFQPEALDALVWRHAAVSSTQPSAGKPRMTLEPSVLDMLSTQQSTDGENFARKTVGVFLQEAPQHIAWMNDALTRDDPEAFDLAAHSLMGSSAALGAQQLSSLCEELPEVYRGDLAACKKSLTQLELEFGRLKRELERFTALSAS